MAAAKGTLGEEHERSGLDDCLAGVNRTFEPLMNGTKARCAQLRNERLRIWLWISKWMATNGCGEVLQRRQSRFWVEIRRRNDLENVIFVLP